MKALAETVFFLFRLLPARVAVWAGRGLGWFAQHVIRLRRRDILDNLERAFPELTDRERRRRLTSIYRHFGLLGVEILRLPRMSNSYIRDTLCIYEGMENIAAARAKGRGVLVLTAHLGNWEIGLAASAACGLPTHAVTKEIKGAFGQYVADRMRQSHGVTTIPRRKSMRQILQALKDGALVGFVLDQNMTSDEGIFVDFFGQPACTMSGLAVLSQRVNAPVVPVLFYRDPDRMHHHFRFLPEIEWETVGDDQQENIRHNTARYTQFIEQAIRDHPAQWIWMHRRWRTRPEPRQ